MFSKKLYLILFVCVACSLGMFAWRLHKIQKQQALLAEQRAAEALKVSHNLRHPIPIAYRQYESGHIAGLVNSRSWSDLRPLSDAQTHSIQALDNLLCESKRVTADLAADYVETNPPDYEDFLSRFRERHPASVRHAERMTAIGLLTEPQAAFVLQQYLSTTPPHHLPFILTQAHIKILLGLSDAQCRTFTHLQNEGAKRSPSPQKFFMTDPDQHEILAKQVIANRKAIADESMAVLTKEQRAKWDQLTTPRVLPKQDLVMPALPETQPQGDGPEELSAVFRAVSEKRETLQLTGAQIELLAKLKPIIKQGLFWIRLRATQGKTPEQVSQATSEFLHHAEEVMLLGILTEKQENQIRISISK